MAMARDGLLPSFFSDVNVRTQVPVKSTILTGIFAATLAFFMDVSQLAGMVSVGTLLAFTIVAISILILRYVPPDEIPLPSSFQESIDSVSIRYSIQNNGEKADSLGNTGSSENHYDGPSQEINKESVNYPLIGKEINPEHFNEQTRRQKATWSIASVCLGVLILTTSASYTFLPNFLRYLACSVGGLLLLGGLFVLVWIDQDDARHNFGHTGGFICPFVPFLPVCCILINAYLLVNLGAGTWFRVSMWLLIGVLVYLFYGRTHSSLTDVVYVPAAHAEEIYRTSPDYRA